MARFKEVQGYALEKKTLFLNASKGHQGATGTWSVATDDGTAFADQGQSSATFVIPVEGVHDNDRIDKFRVLGALGASSGNATVVDADLRKVTKGAGSVSDSSVGAIDQVSVEADTALDAEKGSLSEIVSDDYSYYVLVTVTTAADAACDVSLTGVELDLNQDRP